MDNSVLSPNTSGESYDLYQHLVTAILEVIPNAIIGSFLLNKQLLTDMPSTASQKLLSYSGNLITCFAIPITEDSLWVWHKHGKNRSLLANYILLLAAKNAIVKLKLYDMPVKELTEIVDQDLSMVRLGELAGLGKRGWNNILIHQKWGAWLQINALISSVSAPYAVELDKDVCIHCGNCIKACPVKALKSESFYSIACSSVVASPTRIKSKAIALTENSYIECRECITSCPIGSRSEGIFEWKC